MFNHRDSPTITVTVVRAKNIGTPVDALVYVLGGEQQFITQVKKKTSNPQWQERFIIDASVPQYTFELKERDKYAQDTLVGQVTVNMSSIKLDGSDNWFALHSKSGQRVMGDILLQFSVLEGPRKKPSGPTLPKDAFVTGDKMPSSVRSEIKKRVANFIAEQSVSPTPYVGEPGGPCAMLNLGGIGLTYVTEIVGTELRQLQGLNLGFNKIKNWPQLAPFFRLEVLHLEGNQLTTVSPNLGQLTKLRELHLHGNLLTSLPREISKLVNLEKLSLSNNKLPTVPREIGYLTKLDELSLTGNPMARGLPPQIGECAALEVVDLSCCGLVSLPEEITRLTRIMELNLATNKLKELPGPLGRMTRLCTLDLSDNQLQDLPLSMGYMSGLSLCMLEGNPIRQPRMMEKYKLGSDHLLDFLEKRMMEYLAANPNADLLASSPTSLKSQVSAVRSQDMNAILSPRALSSEQHHRSQPAPNSPQQARPTGVQAMSLEEKLVIVKKEGVTLLADIQFKLSSMKRSLTLTQSIAEAVGYAQILKTIKPELDQAKNWILPFEKPSPPLLQKGEDPLTQLKKTANVAIFDAEKTVLGIQTMILANADARTVVQLIKSTKTIHAALAPIPNRI